MTAAPAWDGDGAAVRARWGLDPDVAYLNHGAYGAAPLAVLAEQARLSREMEREPVDFLYNDLSARMGAARERVAAFLRADPAGVANVPNATTGVATALASVELRPGDEVVTTDHAYKLVRVALQRLAESRGASLVVAPVELPQSADADLAAPVVDALTERTRLVVVDAITSPTALVLPVERIVAACRERGVLCIVDAAHAPGQVDVDLGALDPDFWTGNLHKWLYAPKGTAVLAVRAALRDSVHPLTPSHRVGWGFAEEFDECGTRDLSGWLAAPLGIAVLEELGAERVRAYGRALARWGADLAAERIGVAPPAAPEFHPQMALVDPGPLDDAQADAVYAHLRAAGIEVPLTTWRGRRFVRVSANAYNTPDDYARLADVLPAALAAARRAAG